MKIEAILKNIIFLDNGYFKYQEYQNLGIHSYARHYDTLNNRCIIEDDYARADWSAQSGQRRSWVLFEQAVVP